MAEALLEPGTVVAGYRIEATLGEGGAGQVYRAAPPGGGAPVALKLMRRAQARDEESRRRFLREARAAGEVSHPHLVGVLAAGDADGRPFLVMPYVPGRSLAARIAGEGPLDPAESVRVVGEVARGLQAVHRAGLLHRDVKASNVLLALDGTAALSDFGLAKGRDYSALTRTGQLVGTLEYVAPELLRGEPASRASDLYALGCVAYECLAGRTPFGGGGMFQVGMGHLEREPPDLEASRPGLPAELPRAVGLALAKAPGDRPPTPAAYANLLRAALR